MGILKTPYPLGYAIFLYRGFKELTQSFFTASDYRKSTLKSDILKGLWIGL